MLDDLENRIDENAKSFEIAEQNYNRCVKVIDNAKAKTKTGLWLKQKTRIKGKKSLKKQCKSMALMMKILEILVKDIEKYIVYA